MAGLKRFVTKRNIIHAVMMLFLAAAGWLAVEMLPKRINYELDGIKYQLGAGNETLAEPVKVRIDGYLNKSLTGALSFKGEIDLEGYPPPVPEENRRLSISFDKRHSGLVVYHTVKDGNLIGYSLGILHINDDMSQVSVSLYKEDPKDPSRKSWSGDDGLMISAPAQSREEALDLSNELMRPMLMRPLE